MCIRQVCISNGFKSAPELYMVGSKGSDPFVGIHLLTPRAVTGNPGNPFPGFPDTFLLPDSPGNEFWLSPVPRFPAHHSPIPRTLENFRKILDNLQKIGKNPKK